MNRAQVGRWVRFLRALLVVAGVVLPESAFGATRLHALVVGNNDVFPGPVDDRAAALVPLAYADDDAAAVGTLLGEVAASLHLLTVMDASTQALYPKLVPLSRPPSLVSLERAVSAIAAEIERDRSRGDQSVVWLFFSGHGSASYRGEPALALSDGALSRDYLYRQVLSRLPATHVHLLVDACHAETIVRPRDTNAEVVSVTPDAANAILIRSTLAAFPHVGAILVSSRDAQAHEWDAIGHGVFTHELLSALRGAADVNGDRLIEYSEVSAFMSAANRGIDDARSRVTVSLRAPPLNRRAPLLDLSAFASGKVSWLVGVSGRRGVVQVVDALGRRVLTLHNATEHHASLLLSPSPVLYVVAQGHEARFAARPGQVTRFSDLKFSPVATRSRGFRANALERGLFAVPFGRAYYDGFIDNAPELLPVPFTGEGLREEVDAGADAASPGPASSWRLSLGVGLSNSTADVLGTSYGARAAAAPVEGHGPTLALEGSQSSDGALHEWRAVGKLGWFWQAGSSRLRVHAGPRAGAGIVIQQVEGGRTLSSALGAFGATTGMTTRVGNQLGIFGEVDLSAHLFRQDGATTLSLAPSGWVGAFWEIQ